jgi:hypothetical protein
MSQLDSNIVSLPTTENTDKIVSVPFEEEKVDNTAVLNAAGQTEAMVALDQGNDPVDAYLRATESGDINQMINSWTESTIENRKLMMLSNLDVAPVEAVKKDVEDLTNDMSGQNGILGPYIQKLKTMPSSVGRSEEAIKELALQAFHRQATSSFHPDGLAEGIADFGGVLIPKRKAATVREVAETLGFISSVSENIGAVVDSTDELDAMRNIGLSLEGEDKANYILQVREAVEKSSDNNFIKSEIMEAIFGRGTTRLDPAFEIVDLTFAAQVATAGVKTGKTMFKAASVLNTTRKMKAYDTAAEIVGDAKKAKIVGTTPTDAMDAVNPLVNGKTSEILAGADADTAANITHMLDLQDRRFKLVTGLDREGVLDVETTNRVMRQAELEQLAQPGVVEVKILSHDETGFKMQFATAHMDEAGEVRLKLGTKQVDFQLNQTGKLESPISEYHTAFNRTDPDARMSGRLRNWFVHSVEKLARIQEKTAFSFDNMMKDAFKGLKQKNAANVDFVLSEGAKDGVEYTFQQLTAEGIGKNSLRLSDAEAKAYFGVRNIVNHMYDLKNKQISDNFLALGVKLVDNFDGVVPARVFDSAENAMKGWKTISSDSKWINIADDGLKSGDVPLQLLKLNKKTELTEEMLEKAYEAGYVLAKNHAASSFFKRGQFKTQWALVKKEAAVSPRGQQVLNKLPGYLPKQRTNGFYFIKSNKKGVLSGANKNFEVGETVAWSDTQEGAKAWIAAQDDPAKFSQVFDRELPHAQAAIEVSATHGGMYSGARKSTELPFVGEARAEFADSFEAMQHYINHIGRQYPASLYRLGSEQRLLELAKSLGVKGATGLHDVLQKAITSGFRAPTAGIKGSKEYELLNDIHNQVSFVNMIPTDAELSWAKRLESIGNALEKPLLKKIPGWGNVPKFFYNKASANTHPADMIRGFTFNHLLGMYNPAQILVQFSGAMVSFAVSPIHTVKVLPKAIVGWPMLDLSMGDPRMQAKMIKWMKQNGLKEHAADYELWSRSGYRESVINGNADYTSVFMKNLPYDAGILRKALSNHTIFYKMGELANTRTAFAVAIERYKAANKLAHIDPKDAKALDAISKDTEALRLNMSRANQSDLNRGWKSVPLQFQQVIAKYIEKVLPKGAGGTDEFTGLEKLRLAAIPTAMTGVAGIPLGQAVSVQMIQMMGVTPEELSPEQTQMIKFGAIGWMASEALDVNADFSSRMTLAGDVLDRMHEVVTGNRTIWQWLGPTANVADRYFRNSQFLGEAFDLSVVRNEDVTLDSMKFMVSVLKDIAIDIPTLSRNYKQYMSYFLTKNPQFIKDGKYLYDLETMNERTAFFAIAGFQPQEISELYQVDKQINEGKSAFSKFGDTDTNIIRRILSTHVLNSSLTVEHQKLGAQMVNSILKKYGQIEAMEIMKAVFDKSFNKRFDQNDLYMKHLMDTEKKMQDGMDYFNTIISRKHQEAIGK